MVTVAKRGSINMKVEDGTDINDPGAMCVLVSSVTQRTSLPMKVQRALKWGYWKPV